MTLSKIRIIIMPIRAGIGCWQAQSKIGIESAICFQYKRFGDLLCSLFIDQRRAMSSEAPLSSKKALTRQGKSSIKMLENRWRFSNPDKPGEFATKALRPKGKLMFRFHFRAFVSWWRKCFAIKCKKLTIKRLIKI
jgi:hypothetical protein